MGSLTSKTWTEMSEYYKEMTPNKPIIDVDDNVVHNPHAYSLYLAEDPRSPSDDIYRTPIQMFDIKQNTDNDDISITELLLDRMAIDSDRSIDLSKMSKLSRLLDPRSPTTGVERTPLKLPSNDSMVVNMSSTRLSFGSVFKDSFSSSLDCTPIKDSSETALAESEVNNSISAKQERVRTPLAALQQRQTPIASHARQRSALSIEKRAHFNTHLLKNRLKIENNENNVMPSNVIHDKENF